MFFVEASILPRSPPRHEYVIHSMLALAEFAPMPYNSGLLPGPNEKWADWISAHFVLARSDSRRLLPSRPLVGRFVRRRGSRPLCLVGSGNTDAAPCSVRRGVPSRWWGRRWG